MEVKIEFDKLKVEPTYGGFSHTAYYDMYTENNGKENQTKKH